MPLVLLGIATVAVWTLQNRTSRHTVANAAAQGSSAREATALANQYRQLDARLARLELLLGADQRPQQLGTMAAPPADPAALAAQQQAQTTQLQARFHGLFESEPRANDARKWEAVIARAFSDPNVTSAAEQPSTRAAQCRTRQCQITATFPPDADGNEWATRISMALAEGFSSSRLVWATLPSGESALTIYAFKKGRDKVLVEQGI
ncbi:MAG TPA: hypothetical protein VHF02_04525 [Luteimonas sp.]|nr:hypothetical protein [Luteimonas sp.]